MEGLAGKKVQVFVGLEVSLIIITQRFTLLVEDDNKFRALCE